MTGTKVAQFGEFRTLPVLFSDRPVRVASEIDSVIPRGHRQLTLQEAVRYCIQGRAFERSLKELDQPVWVKVEGFGSVAIERYPYYGDLKIDVSGTSFGRIQGALVAYVPMLPGEQGRREYKARGKEPLRRNFRKDL